LAPINNSWNNYYIFESGAQLTDLKKKLIVEMEINLIGLNEKVRFPRAGRLSFIVDCIANIFSIKSSVGKTS
jgi:hypothetical protein